MKRRNFKPVHPGQQQLSARQFNDAQRTVEALSRPSFGAGIQATVSSSGISVSAQAKGFWAQLSGPAKAVILPGTGGAIPAGTYTLVTSYVFADGHVESASAPTTVTVADSGSLLVTAPQPAGAAIGWTVHLVGGATVSLPGVPVIPTVGFATTQTMLINLNGVTLSYLLNLAYSWSEVAERVDGSLVAFTDARTGAAGMWPAYDPNVTLRKVGDNVFLTPAKGGEYYWISDTKPPIEPF